MKKLMGIAVGCVLVVLVGALVGRAAVEISPSEVFAQAVQVEKEVELLRQHFGIPSQGEAEVVQADLKPRHVWQKTCEILIKINALRRRYDLPRIIPNTMEPVLNLPPGLVFEQTQRILTELAILKVRLDVPGRVTPPKVHVAKKPIDVFNKLHFISGQLDLLNRQEIDPTYVFGEVMRVYEDVDAILSWQEIPDDTFPPAKNPVVTPKESLAAAFLLLAEIQRLQQGLGVERTDFAAFRKVERVAPEDVFNLVGLSLAELQTVKAAMGLRHVITRPAEYNEPKTPADVLQLLGWTTRKLQLVRGARSGERP